MAYTESACDICACACRAGIWIPGPKPASVCLARAPLTAAWRVTHHDRTTTPSHTLAESVTSVPAGVTMLLGCTGCGRSPCLLEVTGPVDRLPCILGLGGRTAAWTAAWFRVTS